MEFLLLWIFFPIIAAVLANAYGRNPVGWFCLGLLVGPFAWAVALLPALGHPVVPDRPAVKLPPGVISLDNESKKCPACAELIKLEALKCRYCGSELDPQEVARAVAARRQNLHRQAKGQRQCPRCESWEVVWAYTEDGSLGWWCPHCAKSLRQLTAGGPQ